MKEHILEASLQNFEDSEIILKIVVPIWIVT